MDHIKIRSILRINFSNWLLLKKIHHVMGLRMLFKGESGPVECEVQGIVVCNMRKEMRRDRKVHNVGCLEKPVTVHLIKQQESKKTISNSCLSIWHKMELLLEIQIRKKQLEKLFNTKSPILMECWNLMKNIIEALKIVQKFTVDVNILKSKMW